MFTKILTMSRVEEKTSLLAIWIPVRLSGWFIQKIYFTYSLHTRWFRLSEWFIRNYFLILEIYFRGFSIWFVLFWGMHFIYQKRIDLLKKLSRNTTKFLRWRRHKDKKFRKSYRTNSFVDEIQLTWTKCLLGVELNKLTVGAYLAI